MQLSCVLNCIVCNTFAVEQCFVTRFKHYRCTLTTNVLRAIDHGRGFTAPLQKHRSWLACVIWVPISVYIFVWYSLLTTINITRNRIDWFKYDYHYYISFLHRAIWRIGPLHVLLQRSIVQWKITRKKVTLGNQYKNVESNEKAKLEKGYPMILSHVPWDAVLRTCGNSSS